jgi:hypothetical protein
MRQMVLAFFRQMFRVSDPAAGFAGTGCLIVPQFAMQCLDQFDAFTQRYAQGLRRFVVEVPEILHAGNPTAVGRRATVVAPFASRIKQALVRIVPFFDESFYQ